MSEASRVLDLIDAIAQESGRKQKEELLQKLLDSELGQFVVKMAYDPFITYGLKPKRQDEHTHNITFRPALVKNLLSELASRKLTGNAAQREVAEVMQALEPAGAELLFRILSKDLRCGIGVTSINAVMPGFIPAFSVMRAQKFEEKRIQSWPQIIEPKLDGYRFTFLCRGGNGGFFSRSGLRQEAVDHLVEPMIQTALAAYQGSVASGSNLHEVLSAGSDSRSLLNFMADGEMIMPGDFNENGVLRSKSENAENATFHIFDLMSYKDFTDPQPGGPTYTVRREWVNEFVRHSTTSAITKTPRYIVNSFTELHAFYQSFRNSGYEGAMVKDPNGAYEKKKSFGWLKMKDEKSEDLPIVGAYPGEPGTKYEDCLGGLIVRRLNGVEVRVGGGFSDQDREELWKLYNADLPKIAGYDENDFANSYDYAALGCRLLGRLIEVVFQDETPDGSLRHPRFKRFRDDKANEDLAA